MESSFPAQQLGPDVEQMYIPREARPPALAGTPEAAHRQRSHQKEVRRGSRALGGTSTRPAELPSGLGRKIKLFFFFFLLL